MLECENSELNETLIRQEDIYSSSIVEVPNNFSLIENPEESYSVIRRIIALALYSPFSENCHRLYKVFKLYIRSSSVIRPNS